MIKVCEQWAACALPWWELLVQDPLEREKNVVLAALCCVQFL